MIITDENLLRVDCEDVLDSEVDNLILTLEQELRQSALMGRPGIGLAAPQIGIAKKAAIIRLSAGNVDYKLNLINCNISNLYNPFTFTQEGCLSFPGRIENTIRYSEVHITNNMVYPHSFTATGLLAIVCQHEIDHWNKTLFVDKIASSK